MDVRREGPRRGMEDETILQYYRFRRRAEYRWVFWAAPCWAFSVCQCVGPMSQLRPASCYRRRFQNVVPTARAHVEACKILQPLRGTAFILGEKKK
jgi:hypothetical protein